MMAENSASQGRYGLGSTHACASTGFGDRIWLVAKANG